MRVTAPRLAVVSVLQARPHSDADTIAEKVRVELGTVSQQAIYNVLTVLVNVGIIRRIKPKDSLSSLYELRVGDNHHHMICRRCGIANDVDCVVGKAPCLTPSQDNGFILDEAEVTFWGLCPTCQEHELEQHL